MAQMKVLTSKLEESTYVSSDDMLFYDLRQAVVPRRDTTPVIEESFELREIPSMLITEQEFDIVVDKESMIFRALDDIQEVAKGRFSDWKEEEHLGEKFLFDMRKGNRRA
jgi:hypothetical protein